MGSSSSFRRWSSETSSMVLLILVNFAVFVTAFSTGHYSNAEDQIGERSPLADRNASMWTDRDLDQYTCTTK